ncbi:hypothetical protein V8F20_007188 [Naviculisporaceae sp. PSN 640]
MASKPGPGLGADDTRHKVRIGVFVPLGCQLLDMACVDILGTMSYEYMSPLEGIIPGPIIKLAPSVEIYCKSDQPRSLTFRYIGSVQPGENIALTSSVSIRCTHNMSAPEVQPGKLDIVLVPGPDPTLTVDEESKKWLAAHAAVPTTDILSICTGALICGAAGILKGKKFCGPRSMQDDLQKKFADQNVRGITNGNDLVAAYARQTSRHFPGPVAEMAVVMTEVGDRPQHYTTGKAATAFGVVWQVVKAVFMGLGSKKKTS